MKKVCLIFLVLPLFFSCSSFKPKISPYPSGIMFPVETDTSIIYEGKITDRLKKDENKLFLSTTKGKVYCIDGNQRQILWEFTSPEPLAGSPYLGISYIFVFDEKNNLYCIDQTGQLKWKKPIPDTITSQLGGSEEQIYIGTEKGTLFCLKAENGETIWSFKADGAIRSNPVMWNDHVIFGCDDHCIYFLNLEGSLIWKFPAGGQIGTTLCLDENFLYFGTANHHIHCLNLKRKKPKWSVYLAGNVVTPPAIKGKNIIFLCSNGVLYCLNKRNGTTLWWNQVSSFSYYKLEITENKVAVSSLSSKLVCFDIETGKNMGTFNASKEIQSNPIWFPPYLLVNLYDRNNDTGELVFLKKQVKVTLSPSKKPPQTVNEEITFTAEATGFHLPEYEFSLSRYTLAFLFFNNMSLVRDSEKTVVQEASEKKTWEWLPLEYGFYNIEVKVTDEKEMASAQYPYVINKEKPKLILATSLESPQEIGTEIVFNTNVTVLEDPKFEFRLIRLKSIGYQAGHLWLSFEDEQIVQESSEKSTWTWVPEEKGIYFLRIIASDSQDKVETLISFIIKPQDSKNQSIF